MWKHGNKINISKQNIKTIFLVSAVLLSTIAIPIWIYDINYSPIKDGTVIAKDVVIVDTQGNVLSTTTEYTTTGGQTIDNPIEHVLYVLDYSTNLNTDDTNGPEHYPWNWIIPGSFPTIIYYANEVQETIIYVQDGYEVTETNIKQPIRWSGARNPVIWYSIWIVVPFLIFNIIKKKNNSQENNLKEVFILCWILSTFLPWIFASLVFSRIVYPFYFINTIPALILGLILFIQHIFKEDSHPIIIGITSSAIAFFILHYPVNIFAL